MDFIVTGGGEFGADCRRRLTRAKVIIDVGKIEVVEKDWDDYLFDMVTTGLPHPSAGSTSSPQAGSGLAMTHLILSHETPHIVLNLYRRLIERDFRGASTKLIPLNEKFGTPFERLCDDGQRVLSFATWRCPAHCIEPKLCPHTRQSRAWDMKEFLRKPSPSPSPFKGEGRVGVCILSCRHLAMGVATIPMTEILDEYRKFSSLVARRSPLEKKNDKVVVATVSSCHGIVGLIKIL